VNNPLPLALQRLGEALSTPLDPAGLALSLALLGLYAAWALPWGRRRGFLRGRWRPSPPLPLLRHALALLLMPSLVEEVLFRVLPLPRAGEGAGPAASLAWSALAVGLFVGYHPLAGRLWYRPGRHLFDDSRFLTLCTGLGLICTLAYLATGSLLAPLLLHWLVVLIWLDPLGGLEHLDTGQGSGQAQG
jgi:predicted Abi (CAAX) family protease